jgi:hypothetical protein
LESEMALDESSADLQETDFLGEISYAASKVGRQFQGGFRAPVGVSRRHQQKDSDLSHGEVRVPQGIHRGRR